MNTIQLECFIAVAEYLNFSKASRELKITQPAVSHQIQTLEEELGVKLFNRTSKSVTLTQEGILFLPDAQLILKTALSAKERLGSHEHFISLELGCHNYMELNLFPPILKKLSAEFPAAAAKYPSGSFSFSSEPHRKQPDPRSAWHQRRPENVSAFFSKSSAPPL